MWQFSSNKAAKTHHSITAVVGFLVASLSHRLLSHSLILWIIHSLSRFQTSKTFSTSSPISNLTVHSPKLEYIIIFVALLIDPNPKRLNCTVCTHRLPSIGRNQVITSFHLHHVPSSSSAFASSCYFLIYFKIQTCINVKWFLLRVKNIQVNKHFKCISLYLLYQVMCWEMTKRQWKVLLVLEIKSCFLETNPWIMAELQEQHTIRAQKNTRR